MDLETQLLDLKNQEIMELPSQTIRRKTTNQVIVILAFFILLTKSFTADWTQSRLVAHALGGIENHSYTNSKDALEANYLFGHRVFEADFATTKDGVMVARHDWEDHLAKHLDQPELGGGIPASLSEFRAHKINHKYTPITLAELANFMSQHEDMWLITDTKSTDPTKIMADFSLLVKTINEIDERVLARIVPQIYNQPMLAIIQKCHVFKNIIYTLYASSDTDDEVVRFCIAEGISAVTMWPARYTQTFAKSLADAHIKVYVHTINDPDEAKTLLSRGVRGLYTDFLKPSDLTQRAMTGN